MVTGAAIGSYPEAVESSSQSHAVLCKVYFNIIIPFDFSFRPPTEIFMHGTYVLHLNVR